MASIGSMKSSLQSPVTVFKGLDCKFCVRLDWFLIFAAILSALVYSSQAYEILTYIDSIPIFSTGKPANLL
jgi:hypothetical protein